AWVDVEGDGVYFTGFFASASFATGGGNLTNKGGNDIYLVRYDTLGNYSWALGAGGTGDDRGSAATADASGAIYFAGLFNGTVDFDPGPDARELISNGNFDMVIAKYVPCKAAEAPTLSSSSSSICPGGNATLS